MRESTTEGKYTEETLNSKFFVNAEDQEDSGASDYASPSHARQSEMSGYESIEAIYRSQTASLVGKTFADMNLGLGSSLLGKTLANMNLGLGSSLVGKTLADMNLGLGSSLVGKTLADMNLGLGSSLLGKTLADMNLGLGSSLLGKTLADMNLGLSVSYVPSIVKPLGARKLILPEIPRPPTPNQDDTEQWSKPGHSSAGDFLSVEEKINWPAQFDALIKDDGLRRFSRGLFVDGHYSLAVDRACIYMHNTVRDKSGLFDKDGSDLMMTVFSPKKPILRLNELETISERNEQQGYMFLLAGTMTGIRNPRAHEHDYEDSPEEALEILVLVNHLMRILGKSTVA